jgi:2-C-methyl-D-erythritol 4-phosphate cytidylyltransferase
VFPSAHPKFAVILPAAGKSRRFHDKHYRKPYAPLADRAVWLHTVDRFIGRKDVAQTIMVIDPEDREMFQTKFGANMAILGVDVVDGGTERADSVDNALAQVHPEVEFIAVHDAVRPCLADEWIDKVFAAAVQSGAAILAIPVVSTLKKSEDGKVVTETVARANLWEAQTPQVFRRDWLTEAYAQRSNSRSTDEAQLVEALGHKITIVPGSRLNLKITTREDLKLATAALKLLPKPKLGGTGNPFAGDDMWR